MNWKALALTALLPLAALAGCDDDDRVRVSYDRGRDIERPRYDDRDHHRRPRHVEAPPMRARPVRLTFVNDTRGAKVMAYHVNDGPMQKVGLAGRGEQLTTTFYLNPRELPATIRWRAGPINDTFIVDRGGGEYVIYPGRKSARPAR